MPVKVDRNQCFFLTHATVDWGALAEALRGPFLEVERTAGGLSLTGRIEGAPSFEVTTFDPGDIPAATGLRGPQATRWKRALRAWPHAVTLRFDDLDQVLDDTNCLIAAQAALQRELEALVVLGWNRNELPFGA